MKTSKKYMKVALNFIGAAGFVFFCCFCIPKLLSFFLPFVIAFLIAWMANPLVKFAESKLKLKRKLGSIVVIILALAFVGLVTYSIISLIIYEIGGLSENIPIWWENASKSVNSAIISSQQKWNVTYKRLPASVQTRIDEAWIKGTGSFSNWVSGLSDGMVDTATRMASNIAVTLVSVIMALIASYFFVADRDYLSGISKKVIPAGIRRRLIIVGKSVREAVGGYFKAQFKIMAVVYVILLVGLLILGVRYSFLIAIIIAFMDFLPFFGTGTIMWPWALIAFLQKDYKMAIGLMIVWGVSQLVRQLIQPKFLSTSVGLPPIPTLFLLFIGFKVGGAIGLIISVPIGMIIVNLYKAGMFSNFIYSIRILIRDFARNRRFTDEELSELGIRKSLPQDEYVDDEED